jgi:hypothetical protein
VESIEKFDGFATIARLNFELNGLAGKTKLFEVDAFEIVDRHEGIGAHGAVRQRGRRTLAEILGSAEIRLAVALANVEGELVHAPSPTTAGRLGPPGVVPPIGPLDGAS